MSLKTTTVLRSRIEPLQLEIAAFRAPPIFLGSARVFEMFLIESQASSEVFPNN